jgi:hypothetical protein
MVVAAATTSPWRPTSARAQKLVLLPGHFDAYVKDFDAASGAARDWFLEHLALS